MAAPADPRSVMELDPGEENVSFLVRVILHPCVCYFKVTPAKFRSSKRFCFAIVDATGQPTTNGSLPSSTSGPGGWKTS